MSETVTRILVPVDFSPPSERALRYAALVAKRFNAAIGLLHVVEDPFATGAWHGETYVPDLGELLRHLMAEAEQRLAAVATSASEHRVTVETAVITGRPAQAIVRHAREHGFDLIIMGTHGRTGLSHVVIGSVAERVLRKAPCPVLTMRGDAPAADANVAAA